MEQSGDSRLQEKKTTTMRWEELTGDQFALAVQQSEGVCLIALSVIERHGHHMPLGTDMYIGQELLGRVAELEPAVLFPNYIFTQIPEARHSIGTISIDPDLMVRLLDNVCAEIARNGLKKIVLVNCHGGNNSFLPFFTEWQLSRPRDYIVYLVQPTSTLADTPDLPWSPETEGGHAGPGETSMILAMRPELVDMQEVPENDEGQALKRLQALKEVGVRTGIWWYADYPTHYAGHAVAAQAEVGDRLFDRMAQYVARAVRVIKADTETERLLKEFYAASQEPSVPQRPTGN